MSFIAQIKTIPMTTEVVLSAREWRKINRKNRRYRQQIKRHPEKEILVSGPCNKLKELAEKNQKRTDAGVTSW